MHIEELKLYTQDIEEQREFYVNTLGFKLIHSGASSISLTIGKSILTFQLTDQKVEQYHFAFNIPSNQEKEALTWLKQRVEIIKFEENEIQYFDFWDAHAIYFYDADNNIVEFISRKTLQFNSSEVFSIKSILNICEIGTPTSHIQNTREILLNTIGLVQYSGDETRFSAIGDDEGLFICINKDVKKYWFPTNEKAHAEEYTVNIKNHSNRFCLEFKKGHLKLV